MTKYQKELYEQIKSILADGPKNTSQIARERGDYQVYETHLRDRLFSLAAKGLIQYEERKSANYGQVIERIWGLNGDSGEGR